MVKKLKKIISELKTKEEINRLTSEDVRTLFEESDNYEEFINNLYSFMTRDIGYKFYIHNKKDIITQGIIDAKCESSFDRKEKHIMNELNGLNDLSFGFLEELKTQYNVLSLYGLRVPRRQIDKFDYSKVIEEGYKNVQIIDDFWMNANLRATEELRSNAYFLTTVNMILNDYPKEYADFVFAYIKQIISYPDLDKFENRKQLNDYNVYQAKTLKKFYKVEKERSLK